ncbi:MAG: NAD(P)/FAD-dependent oxidoreductase [Geminicoccaceae bacterium]
MRVAICGGGVIGACLAYYLSREGAQALLVERHEIAGAASGKSGGFLALDWCDGSALAPLARRSFQLHAELADAHGNPWGYRRLDTFGAVADMKGGLAIDRRGASLPWLRADVMVQGQLGTTETTAQVTPAVFTRGMAEEATARGAECLIGEVNGIALDRDGTGVQGVEIDGRLREADAVVIAMGPWSAIAARWLPLPDVYGLKGHSVIFRPTKSVPAEALFADVRGGDGANDAPELFPRPDGTVYLCGLSGHEPLPANPNTIDTDAATTACLRAMAAALSPDLADAEILTAQACYRPMTRDGLPLMGAVPGIEGAYVATGHSVWGMLNAPASGEAMAQLILGGCSEVVDLSAFGPGRFSGPRS